MKTYKRYTEHYDGDPSKDRDKFIGGSDVGTILGVNPYKSAYTLFLEKTGAIIPEDISNKLQVRLGNKMEQVVAELYEEEENVKVQTSDKTFKIKELPYLAAHVDRLLVDKEKGLEIKTTSSHNRIDYESGEVPPTHYYQCMFYMFMTGYKEWDLATLRDNSQFYINHVTYDEEQAEYMLEEINKFWKCVESQEWTLPIDYSESTNTSIERAYGNVETQKEEIEIRSAELIAQAKNYDNVVSTIKDLKEIQSQFENEVKAFMQDNENAIMQAKDGTMYKVTWKPYARKGGYDIARMISENPNIEELVEKYRKEDVKARRFTIKKIDTNKMLTK